MADRCPTDVKYEFHGMDMDIYKDFSPSEEYKMTEYQHGYQDGFHAGVIYERSQAEPKSGRWIPCSEKLPEDGERILITNGIWIDIDECQVKNGINALNAYWTWDGIEAWMPLPEPYNRDEEEE